MKRFVLLLSAGLVGGLFLAVLAAGTPRTSPIYPELATQDTLLECQNALGTLTTTSTANALTLTGTGNKNFTTQDARLVTLQSSLDRMGGAASSLAVAKNTWVQITNPSRVHKLALRTTTNGGTATITVFTAPAADGVGATIALRGDTLAPARNVPLTAGTVAINAVYHDAFAVCVDAGYVYILEAAASAGGTYTLSGE